MQGNPIAYTRVYISTKDGVESLNSSHTRRESESTYVRSRGSPTAQNSRQKLAGRGGAARSIHARTYSFRAARIRNILRITVRPRAHPPASRRTSPVSRPWSATGSNFLGISRDFADLRSNNSKTNDDRPVLSAMHRLRWYIAGLSSARESTITVPWVKMAILNLYTRKYLAIRKLRLLLTINWNLL